MPARPASAVFSRLALLFLVCAIWPASRFSVTAQSSSNASVPSTARAKDTDDPAGREEWFSRGRQGIPGHPAAELRHRAYAQKMQLRAKNRAKANLSLSAAQPLSSSNPAWVSLGPSPINLNPGPDFGDYGFVVGRVTAIAVDPTDFSGNTVYAGGAYGGLWKSTNAAALNPASVNWTPLLDDQATLAVGAVTVKPDNAQILLVGTGEPNNSPETYYGVGILRSADAGSTWTLVSTADNGAWSFRGVGFSRIVFSADNPSLAVAGAAQTNADGLGASQPTTRVGLYYSLDTGLTWHLASVTDAGAPIAQASATDVVYNPVQHKFFAAIRFHGIYSSTDGISWSRLPVQPSGNSLTEGACPPARSISCPLYRGAIAVRPGTDEMYVWLTDGSTDLGIFQSKDGGASWTQIESPSYFSCIPDASGCMDGLQLPYNFTIAAVPTAAGTDLYIGHVNLLKCSISSANPVCHNNDTTTGNWLNLTHVYGCMPPAPSHVHPDEHAIEIVTANPNIIYFGNDGGVYRTLSASTGLVNGSCVPNAFDNLDANFGSMAQFVSFSVHPTDASTLLGGTQDNGSPAVDSVHSGANGLTWQAVATGDGAYNEINPNQPDEWFTAETHVSIFRCPLGITCRQADFQLVVSTPQLDFDDSEFYTPYLLDPQNTNSILLGTCRVWRGPSSGIGWSSTNALSFNFDTSVASVCVSPANLVTSLAAGGPATANGSQVIYAGTAAGNIFVTTNADGGPASWTQSLLTNNRNFPVSSIALDGHDATGRTAYAAVMGFGAGHVLKTTDGGANWTDITGNLPDAPADSVIVDPNDGNIIYVGTDVGVFQTQNAGANWIEYGPASGVGALPDVAVTRLRIFGKQKLRASTYGRGVWETSLASSADYELVVSDPTAITLFPAQTSNFQGTLTSFNNYASNVGISCSSSGPPLPATCQGSTVPLTATPAAFSLQVSNPTVGDFSFNIRGKGFDANSITHDQPVQVHVADFGLSALNPAAITMARGTSSPPIGLTVSASGSFKSAVTLSCSGLPAGSTCNFSPATVSPTGGSPANVTLSISTLLTTPAATTPVTVTGTANSTVGAATRSSSLNLTTTLNPQFLLNANPAALHSRVGETTGVPANVNLSPQDGYSGTVALTCSVYPVGPTCGLAQTSFSTFPSSTTLTIKPNGSPLGVYTVTISGTDNTNKHLLNVPYSITDFSLSGPATSTTATGQILPLAWTVVPLTGYTGTLTLSCDATSLGAQATCSLPPTLDMTAGFLTGFFVRVSVPAGVPPGKYPITVLGNDGFLSHSQLVQLVVVSGTALQVTGISPQEEQDGRIPVGMTLFGSNFTPQSKVLIDGVDYGATVPSSSSTILGVATPTQIFNQVTTHQFSVTDPQLGNSNSVPFRIFIPDETSLSLNTPVNVTLPPFFGGAPDVVAGDFENAGRRDLAVLGTQIALLHNDGRGNFSPVGMTPYQGANPQTLLAGDVNGDGNLDLIVVNQAQVAGSDSNANFSVLLGDGHGHFTAGSNFSLPVNPFQAALLDLTGDSKLDLLVATGAGLALLPGNGDGTFGPAINIGPAVNFTLGDINGDGVMDIFLNGPDQIRLLLNNGAGSFQEIDPPSLEGLTGSIAVGDFNGDGHLDLFIRGADELPGFAKVLLGDGKGSFTTLPEFQFLAPECVSGVQNSFVAADFDGDGKLDLAVGSSEAHPGRVAFLWGKGDGTFVTQVVNGLQAPLVKAAELTGDNIPDLIAFGNSLSIIPGDPNRKIASPPILTENGAGGIISTADVNGDGLPDIYRGGEVFLNRGKGVFSAPILAPGGLRIGDLNGDGLADLVGCMGNSIQIWPGDGSGTFSSSSLNIPIGVPCPSDVKIVDLDRDGRLDIVGTGFILYGAGGFNFDLVSIPGRFDGPLLIGDFDGDGRLDIIETSSGYTLFAQPGRTFRAVFSPGGTVPVADISAYAVADFNADGKDDVAAASRDNSEPISVLLSQGDGTFLTKSILSPVFLGFGTDMVVGDFNGDGFPDLAVAPHLFPAQLVFLINDGHGEFRRAIYPAPLSISAIAAEDFDHDGKSDLVFGNDPSLSCPAQMAVISSSGNPSSFADFSLTRGVRTSQTIDAGQAADAYDLFFTPRDQTTGPVTLVCQGLPAGAICQFSPVLPLDSSRGASLVSVSVQTTLGVTPPGAYSFLVLGKSPNAVKSADGPFTLTVKTTLPDLVVAISPPSSPPPVGNPHSYHIAISNSGTTATGVQLEVTFSLMGSVSSATPQQGSCVVGPPVNCSLGSIGPAQSVSVDITAVFLPDGVSPVSNGSLTVAATVTENETDAVLSDNTATLNETVADFQLNPTPASVTVPSGQNANYTISAASRLAAFSAAVQFTCTNLPAHAACIFSPASVTPGATASSTALTVTTISSTAAALAPPAPPVLLPFPNAVVIALGVMLLALGLKERRSAFATQYLLLIVVAFVLLLGACGGGGSPSPPPPPPPQFKTPPGTYTVTVTGTSGAAQRSAQITLVVQ
jgi:hypothetical protein